MTRRIPIQTGTEADRCPDRGEDRALHQQVEMGLSDSTELTDADPFERLGPLDHRDHGPAGEDADGQLADSQLDEERQEFCSFRDRRRN